MRPIIAVILLTFAGLQGLELRVVEQVEPRYPPLAQAARVQKPVKLTLKVNPDGTVQDATIVDGHPLLNLAAIEAAKQWKFNTTPFGGTFNLTLPFALPATGKITGRVTDSEGRPMAGVRISSRKLYYNLGRRGWNLDLVGGVTDRDGIYTISRTGTGDYFVVASYQVPSDAAAGSADRLSPKTFYPGTTDGVAAATVFLRIDATAIADIRIPEADTVRVSGKVIVPTLEQPARSPLDIRLLKLNPEFTDEPINGSSVRIDSQQQSEIPFNFRGVPPGLYQMTATVATGPPPTWAYSGRVAIEVRDRNVENATLTLQRNTEFKGRVVVQDPSIRLQNVLVGLIAHGFSGGGGFFPVGADGTVRFFNVPEETYNVTMQGDLGTAYVSDLRLGAKSIYADGILTVVSGATEDLQIVLRSNGGSIDGSVLTSLREGVNGAQVILVPDLARRKNPIFYGSVKADASGAFRFRALAPGEYKLFAFAAAPPDGATQNAEFMARYEQRGVRVVVRDGTAESGVILSVIPAP